MITVHPDTLAKIERAVPIANPPPALDVWKRSGGISHQHVKNGLKQLVERGLVLRTQRLVEKRACFHYQRVEQ